VRITPHVGSSSRSRSSSSSWFCHAVMSAVFVFDQSESLCTIPSINQLTIEFQ